jgi:DNA-binding transcriptional ArsR family regulator
MSSCSFVTKEMAALLGVLAHPQRIQIIEELRNGELDVNSLQVILGVSHSRVSQHLAVLRSHRVVVERREGRSVFYRLMQPRLAKWLLDGFEFLAVEAHYGSEIREALDHTRKVWAPTEPARGGAGVTIGNPRPQEQED